jgi:hypothetical protein
MAHDDWRIRITLPEQHVETFWERIGLDLSPEARELAKALAGRRLAVSRADDTVFVYAAARSEAAQALAVIQAELEREGRGDAETVIEQWLDGEDRWDDEPAALDAEQELLARGYAPWEVRVTTASRKEARALAERLEAEGCSTVRGWQHLIVGVATRQEADALAERLHGTVAPGGELVWEVRPGNPFALLGGLGS